MEKKEQKKIISSIWFNLSMIFVMGAVIWFYLMPEYEILHTQMTEANDIYTNLNKLKSDWLKADWFEKILIEENKMTQWMAEILKDKPKVNKVIQKVWNKDYMTWIKEEVLKWNEYSKEAEDNDRIIWSILPVFYKYSDSNKGQGIGANIKEQITLGSFTKYVEDEILKKHDIESFSPVWIENITFDADDKPAVAKAQKLNETIWSFAFNLDFEAKNKNIITLVDSIQKSWRLDIQNWKLMNKVSSDKDNSNISSLDNLLITIDSLSVQDPMSALDKTNKGTMKLRFYVSWIWYEQLITIKKSINDKFTKLYADMLMKSKMCDNWDIPLCKDNIGSQSVWSIRSLLKEATQVKTRLDALVKDANMTWLDINQALTSWLNLGSAVDTIDTAYKKSASYIDNFSAAWNN
ncbi:MAG: hypothetical protein ACD_2C00038G0002 [uncultured bacterium (gcode 4)]|uniref:Uncharacterized protein n=1 Tax=uncultured bacterium (gcode 4) TaxID=1234023 RepID=K2H2R2_9BACT|nr:MAG: hypothetical protein ACD_2C00038G0002 [uncultured bacterium (gcode 4)]